MKLITRDTDYALRAVCYIAKEKDKVVSAAELVKKLRIPRPFLRKILQALNKKRILVSYKGKNGGFLLARPVDKLYLMELIKAFQGGLEINQCLFKKKLCPNVKTCALRKKIDDIQDYAVRHLENVTIKDLLGGE